MTEMKYCVYCGHKLAKKDVHEDDEEFITIRCGQCKREWSWGID